MNATADTIALIGFSQREQNLLEVFFAGSDAPGLSLQHPDRASALLINLDTDAALSSFRRWASDKRERRPVIAVIASTPAPDGLISLPRPLTLTALKQALQRLRAELKQRRAYGAERASDEDPVLARYRKPAPPAPVDRDTFRAVVAEARLANAGTGEGPVRRGRQELQRRGVSLLAWPADLRHELEQQSCGTLPDLDLSLESSRRRLEFSLRGSLLAAALDAVEQGRTSGCAEQILGVPGALVYFPATDRFSYDLDPELLLQMTRARFGPEELRVRQRADLKSPLAASVARDELLWFVALMTARGRLPAGMAVDQPRQLQRRPDFERFLKVPNGNSIAELWSASPHSALDVAELLSIPQRPVFSFLVAADAAGLFERNQGVGHVR